MPTIKTDFNKFNEKGLKPVINKFKTVGLPVSSVDATNKAKRESGYLVKVAHFFFNDGQKLTIKSKADGDIFQVKLNNKVMPIKNEDNLSKAVKEIIGFVKGNAAKFANNKARRDAKLKVKPSAVVPKIKSALPDKIKAASETLSTAIKGNEILNAQISEFKSSQLEKQKELEGLQSTLSGLEGVIDTLKKELISRQEAA